MGDNWRQAGYIVNNRLLIKMHIASEPSFFMELIMKHRRSASLALVASLIASCGVANAQGFPSGQTQSLSSDSTSSFDASGKFGGGDPGFSSFSSASGGGFFGGLDPTGFTFITGVGGGSAAFSGLSAGSITQAATAGSRVSLIQPSFITPVDQNQLNGQGLQTLVDGPPKVQPGKTSMLADLSSVLPGVPGQVSEDTQAPESFSDIAKELEQRTGQILTGASLDTLMVNRTDENTNPFGGSKVTLVAECPSSEDISSLEMLYLDPRTNQYVHVQPSRNSEMRRDKETHSVAIDLDETSVPSTADLVSAVPKPILTASLDSPVLPFGDFIAVANDTHIIPGYLMREDKHNEVFVLSKNASGFYYANQPSVLLQGTLAPGMVTVCDTATLVGENDQGINVLNGKTLFMLGMEPFKAHVPAASLQIPADSSVVVEYDKASSESKIGVISQRDHEPTMVRSLIGRPLFLAPGRGVTLYQDLPGLKRFQLASKTGNHVVTKAMLRKMEEFTVKQAEELGSKKFAHVLKRRFANPTAEPRRVVADGRTLWNTSPVRLLCADQTIFSLENSNISLMTGQVFVHATNPISVKTEVAQLNAKSQADFNISYSTGSERIDVLSGPGLVDIRVGDETSSLNPGQEVVIASRPLSQKLLLPQDGIARRAFHQITVGNTKVSTCDFSIGTMLKNSTYLSYLRLPRNPIDDSLRDRLLKTACAVTFATSGKGTYFSSGH